MAQNFFEVEQGFAVADHATGSTVFQFMPIAGVPGDAGLSADELLLSNSAPLGASALDTSTGLVYRKKTAGTGSDKWVKLEDKDTTDALQAQIDAFQNGISWREPAKVLDSSVYANLAAAETAVNTGTIDGVATIAEGDRILFDAITGSNKNVYVVTGTVGAGATLVESSNTATLNDTLYINEGTSAGKRVSFNGTDWIVSNLADASEQGYIRDFIGKGAAGVETPVYSSAEKVTQNGNLEAAIGELDAEANRIGRVTTGTGSGHYVYSPVDASDLYIFEAVVTDGAGNSAASTIKAIHDGTNAADATEVDFSVSDKLKVGSIAGLKYQVSLTGSGAGQSVLLAVTATGTINVAVQTTTLSVA